MNRVVIVTHVDAPVDLRLGEIVTHTDYLIGVDGGALSILSAGLSPDLVVGDMDSLGDARLAELRTRGIATTEFPAEKDYTDLELALLYALERPELEILVATRTAGRPDHSLANLLLLTDPRFAMKRISIVDGEFLGLVLHGSARLLIEDSNEALLSIVPVSDWLRGLSIAGARWLLEDTDVPRGTTRCLSNVITSNLAEISVREGVALVLCRGVTPVKVRAALY